MMDAAVVNPEEVLVEGEPHLADGRRSCCCSDPVGHFPSMKKQQLPGDGRRRRRKRWRKEQDTQEEEEKEENSRRKEVR